MNIIERITLQELKERPHTTSEIAQKSEITEAEVIFQLRDLNERVKKLLGYKEDAITVTSAGAWRADGVAGLLRLNSRIELEVAPKFLNPYSQTWRSDFFLLAVLVKTGHLLIHDDIRADTQERGDLATLVARSLLALVEENSRRPIRGYKRTQGTEFSIDGDVEWDTLTLPEPDGFVLSRLELTRQNPYNATLAAAAHILIPEVEDGDTQVQLEHLARTLAPQPAPPTVFPPLPPRHHSWQQSYDLAQLVVAGLGLDLKGGTFTGPGFILSTWAAWQALCEEIVRRALPNRAVVGQKKWIIGRRGTNPVYVNPDISVLTGAKVDFLLDAKYKTRVERKSSIASTDVYESLAFLKAANATYMGLLYPSTQDPSDLPLGKWTTFDEVVIDHMTIEGIEFQIQGLAHRGGFDRLVEGARAALFLPPASPTF
ncbi:McrC family protein [Rhodococcus pyridinivorans]|uniref:McrC family protein n=1 Tax=Rhodococcus pyridinivorans TaxID=103816 RepID=UPI0022276512|nr:McrC family protein [Rhodococcus pyridinivorans]MCW3471856.1 McrC family protein [Rhodococcus pyridinivorans]